MRVKLKEVASGSFCIIHYELCCVVGGNTRIQGKKRPEDDDILVHPVADGPQGFVVQSKIFKQFHEDTEVEIYCNSWKSR